jgi:glutathione S-transferase
VRVYNSKISPFGARVVIAARAKNLPMETLALPPEWRKSPEIQALNPIIKIPILIGDDGVALPESETILRYIEDRHPEPTLLPASAEHRAQMNLLIRIADLYVSTPMIRLFPHLAPDRRDTRVVEAEVAHWRTGLANLAYFLERPLDRPAGGLTLADCALAPTLHLCGLIARLLGLGDMLAPHAVIANYYQGMEAHPVVGPVLADLTEAQSAMH